MRKNLSFIFILLLNVYVSFSAVLHPVEVKPITGSWINLVYQDVRNKYINPQYFDNTDPRMWEEKIKEMSEIGIEYLVFMAVANDGKSFYPSKIMPWAYSQNRQSPVDAIMSTANKLGIKVFMSIGWAKDQDDDLRNPEIKGRQLQIMEELAGLYGNYKSFYGWYLPVEDCFCPIPSDYAVVAVNDLTVRARSLTPGKKVMISPYGLADSDFSNPDYEKQIAKLNVDIIAYQDEVGCIREVCPFTHLEDNFKKLRTIHDKLNIELWANCESFTWENATNDRTSALLPAAFPRFLSQMSTASSAEVDRIISFIMCGIYEKPQSKFQLGQPIWSNQVYNDYMDWQNKRGRWPYLEASFTGRLKNNVDEGKIKGNSRLQKLLDGKAAKENDKDERWVSFDIGYHELVVDMGKSTRINNVMLRMLNYNSQNILFPLKVYLFGSKDGFNYELLLVKDSPYFGNQLHDAWIDGVWFENIKKDVQYIKVAFNAERKVCLDELYINPQL